MRRHAIRNVFEWIGIGLGVVVGLSIIFSGTSRTKKLIVRNLRASIYLRMLLPSNVVNISMRHPVAAVTVMTWIIWITAINRNN
jgi:hypothetical protein